MTKIGENIKKLRQVKNLTQQAFADLFEVSRGNISSYSQIDIPAIFFGSSGNLVEALGVGDDLGSVECLTNVFDEGLLLIVGEVQVAVRAIEALLGGFLT